VKLIEIASEGLNIESGTDTIETTNKKKEKEEKIKEDI